MPKEQVSLSIAGENAYIIDNVTKQKIKEL